MKLVHGQRFAPQPLDGRHEHGRIHGFGEVELESGGEHAVAVFFGRVGCQRRRRKARNLVHLVYSQAAQIVAKQELDFTLPARPQDAEQLFAERFGQFSGELKVFGIQDWYAPMASGSNPGDAMVICPCTMGTLGKIAGGIGDDLICRAADVMLKEKRALILLPREMPFSAIHLENMLRLSHAGAVIMPPNPGFYHHPQSVQDMVDFVVARVMDHLGVEQTLMEKWGE
jgi:4-hydroxy-3-polyprenylbenzoate decarboxylase